MITQLNDYYDWIEKSRKSYNQINQILDYLFTKIVNFYMKYFCIFVVLYLE